VRDDAEEQYVSYTFLRQSGTQCGNLKVDLQNDFTTGDNPYPKNCQQNLHLLYKYSKTVVTRVTQSEGTSFAQRSGRGGGNICNGNGRNGNRKSMNPAFMTRSTGIKMSATSTTRRGTQQRIALRNQMDWARTMTMTIYLWQAYPAAFER
jgi:hypothetical protein